MARAEGHGGPTQPEEVYREFEERANAGDADALAELYEANATIMPQPGQVVTGKEDIRAALGQLLSLGLKFRAEATRVLRADDMALLRGTWTATGEAPDGTPISLSGIDAVVVRRQADGTWRMVVDDANFVA